MTLRSVHHTPFALRAASALLMTGVIVTSTAATAVAAVAPADDRGELVAQPLARHVEADPQTSAQPARLDAAAARVPALPARPEVFATVDGEELVIPGSARKVGFHESGDERALELEPVGRLDVNLNPDRVTLPAVSGDSDSEYMVLPTRNRAGGGTTAVDVSMTHGEQVVSPVAGTVTAVSDYSLYGTTPDTIVEVQPAGAPHLVVRMMHLEDVQVEVGDVVVDGATPIADTALQLPFASQIDRHAGTHPHVHIEVHRS
jgi:biotin carboxyl carrier protein